jgi:hypothetical protein
MVKISVIEMIPEAEEDDGNPPDFDVTYVLAGHG